MLYKSKVIVLLSFISRIVEALKNKISLEMEDYSNYDTIYCYCMYHVYKNELEKERELS
ncbi:hypothetical protein IIU_05920 [Bacillus cereus VD133]|uniref:Uncharacterized protein n=1 Tax=Bacillus cereus VD133 TaxID=1053233 RepID=A0A9W5PL81_BACCE|nr:hypothetical protein IIU_05920 [Bacillus cereus VD133]